MSECAPCRRNRHVECFSVLSDHPDDQCDCYDNDPERHETREALDFAMYGEVGGE